MNALELLNDLAAKIGIGRLVPEADGGVTLLFDDAHEVSFTPAEEDNAVVFQCELADASRLRPEDFRALLEASLAETGGAGFAIHRQLDKLLLWKHFSEFNSAAELEKAINDFLAQVILWKERLANGSFSDTASAPGGDFEHPFNLATNFIQA